MASTLDGVTVLDLTAGAAGALATMFLADHGARVVRAVHDGAPCVRTGGFVVWDRGKECVALDIDAALAGAGAPAALYERLVAGADVLVEDFAPGAPHQRLVDPDWLARVNPRLVSCSITAYGKHGPLKDEPPIDDLVLARTGVLGGMPGFRPAPVHVVHPLPSVGAAIFACIGVAAALLARERTGRGRTVETSLMAGALLYHPKVAAERLAPHVFQTHPAGSAPFYSVYECADGRWVQLGCVHPGFIAIAAKLMGIGELVAEPRFLNGRGGKTPADEAEMRETVARILRTRPYADWAAAFEAADVPFAPARLTVEGLEDPQVVHNGMVVALDDPAVGPVVQMGVPIHLSATPGRVRGPRTVAAAEGLPAGYPAPADAAPSRMQEVEAPPLAGVRVLEITNLIAGPTGGRLLADLGADVIKLEPPEGDISRPIGRTYFYNVNFNKRSVCIDTRQEAGKKAVQAIAASADALLANLRPHATERMGIGPALNPRLIEAHITGYGWTGPYSHRPGIDPLAQALMGLERAQGGPDNPPVFPAQLAPTDYTTGAMAALGIVLALLHRTRTGNVQRVDSNLLNGAIVLSSAWFTRYEGRPERPLADRAQHGLDPFHRLYRVRDGWLYLAADGQAARRSLCEMLGVAAADTAEGGGHPAEAPPAGAIAAALEDRPLTEALAVLRRAGVPCAEAQAGDSELFLDDPHSLANGMVVTREHPGVGRMRVAWQYIQFGGTALTEGRPTPLLGEHSAEVLTEVGYDAVTVDRLLDDGVIRTETV